MLKSYARIFLVCLFIFALALPAAAQDEPSVTVADQVSLDGTVTIASAYSDGPGFIVIHVDNGEGRPGPVAGYAALNPGWNFNITVRLNTSMATPTMFAMLHTDNNEVGVYEFGTVDGADGPVRDADNNVIVPPFNVELIHARDQLRTDDTVTVDVVITQQDGWLVIHSEAEGRPGPVLGYAPVSAGVNTDVVVELAGDITPVLWPMLHVDSGEIGEYEFGTVQGADVPVRIDGVVATVPFWTVPYMRVPDQVVVPGDGAEMASPATVVADSVLAEVDGWLVIHSDGGGSPGPGLGYAPVSAGLNENVVVEVEGDITPVLWPMLHVDTGEAGVYEFGEVQGVDGPVRVNDQVVTFPINAAPSINFSSTLEDGVLTIASALIDAPGWMAIHSGAEGSPGLVIGHAPLRPGVNTNIAVTLTEDPGALVFPMLHYDTGEAGVYEFGAVQGVDGPVRVGGAVVVGPLELEAAEEEEAVDPAPPAAEEEAVDEPAAVDPYDCTVTASQTVNLRGGPGTGFAVAGTLEPGASLSAVGQAQGADGLRWYNLDNGAWVRSDIVQAEGECDSLPTVEAPPAPAAPAEPAEPAATEEADS